MTTQPIKPCPFCRSTLAVAWCDKLGLVKPQHYVLCSCGARGPRSETEIGAVTLWNVRVNLGQQMRRTRPDVIESPQEDQPQ